MSFNEEGRSMGLLGQAAVLQKSKDYADEKLAGIFEAFDPTKTYAEGEYCIYNNSIYECTTAVTTAGEWDPNDWTITNFASIAEGKIDKSSIASAADVQAIIDDYE